MLALRREHLRRREDGRRLRGGGGARQQHGAQCERDRRRGSKHTYAIGIRVARLKRVHASPVSASRPL
jgi:hypothetical protein